MQLREDNLDARQSDPRHLIDGNTSTVISNRSRMIRVQSNINCVAETLEGLINGIINNFPQAVHKATVVRRTDVHTGALADSFQTFKN